MVDMCDACGSARALTSWIWCADDDPTVRELTYCGHCSDGIAEAMVDAEWVQVEDGRVEV